MASQQITIAKIGGVSAEVVLQRLGEWSASRVTDDQDSWSPQQWPEHFRKMADEFAERMRTHAFAPPMVHFVEWADLWSMGDLFLNWLMPPGGQKPLAICANRYEIFAYGLPDGGWLAKHLAAAGPQQWTEVDWFVGRLREAIEAWQELGECAVLIILRRVVDGSSTDEEVRDSMRTIASWLS